MNRLLNSYGNSGYRAIVTSAATGVTQQDKAGDDNNSCLAVLNRVKLTVNGTRLTSGHSMIGAIIDEGEGFQSITLDGKAVGIRDDVSIMLVTNGKDRILRVITVDGKESECDVSNMPKFQRIVELARETVRPKLAPALRGRQAPILGGTAPCSIRGRQETRMAQEQTQTQRNADAARGQAQRNADAARGYAPRDQVTTGGFTEVDVHVSEPDLQEDGVAAEATLVAAYSVNGSRYTRHITFVVDRNGGVVPVDSFPVESVYGTQGELVADARDHPTFNHLNTYRSVIRPKLEEIGIYGGPSAPPQNAPTAHLVHSGEALVELNSNWNADLISNVRNSSSISGESICSFKHGKAIIVTIDVDEDDLTFKQIHINLNEDVVGIIGPERLTFTARDLNGEHGELLTKIMLSVVDIS